MEKLTYKNAVEFVLNKYELPDDIKEKLEELTKTLTRKSSSSGKLTKEQKHNFELADIIYTAMLDNTIYTTRDIQKLSPELEDLSSQKITALMKLLADKVEKTNDKDKKANYQKR